MGFYDEMQKVASDVLKEFKQGVIQYIAIVPGNGPIDNPGPSTPVPTVVDATASGVSAKYVRDGLALSTDLTVIMAVHPTVVPNMKGFFDIDGARYKIVQDISAPAAGTRVVYKFIVRKG